jgi:hypothetical protein
MTSALNSVPGIYMTAGTSGVVAPVHLPHGAVVISMLVYLYDNSAGENLIVNLFGGNELGIASGMGNISSTGTPGNTLVVDNTITNPIIDNTTGYYYIHATSSAATWTDFNLRVSRVQINYTISNPN